VTRRFIVTATLALVLPASILPGPGTSWVSRLAALQAPPGRSRQLVPEGTGATVIDITAVDVNSRPVTDLTADDLSIALDGVPRSIVRVRYVPRTALPSSRQRIEPAPVVVLVVDERTVGRESERAVRTSTARLVDELFDQLGPDVRLALVRWPQQRSVLLTRDRRSVQSEIARLRARAEEPSALLPGEVSPRICTGPECDRALAAAGADGPRDALLAAQAISVRATLWEHGRASLSGLAALGRELRDLPGTKIVLVLAPGLLVDKGDPDLDRLSDITALSRVSLYALELPAPYWLRAFYDAPFVDRLMETAPGNPIPSAATGSVAYGRDGLSLIADRNGGSLWSFVGPDASRAAESLTRELSALYAVEVQPNESDRDGRVHRLSVTTRRAGVRLRVRARWAARDDHRDLPEPAAPQPPAHRVSSAPDKASLEPGEVFPEINAGIDSVRRRCPVPANIRASLAELLSCAADAIDDFEREFSSIVMEERLEQMARVRDSAGFIYPKRRTTRADMLLVEDPTGGWMPFRDVVEVDGVSLSDREGRLTKLFLERPATAIQQARAIAEESARFNIGSIGRTINVPTLPLLFLKRVNVARFALKDGREETLGGIRARVVKYSERSRPTFISNSRGTDLPASGSFWIDPQTGCVLATRMDVSDALVDVKALVTYAPDPASGLWVPSEMREQYRRDTDDRDFVNTRASYSKFRRFRVTTTETVKTP